MEAENTKSKSSEDVAGLRHMIRDVIQEFVRMQNSREEPAYKAELLEERRRREQLESRLNELVEENKRNRQRAEEIERSAAIKNELQRLGVTKIELAFRAVKDDITRTEDGSLVARTPQGETTIQEYLSAFVNENPELLPARVSGGSGAMSQSRVQSPGSPNLDLDRIKPGMDPEEMQRMRQEIARIASQTLRGVERP
jgi:hypothetical protein